MTLPEMGHDWPVVTMGQAVAEFVRQQVLGLNRLNIGQTYGLG